MSKPRVLISGASVAGPALAFWLVRAGCRVTIVERASILRTAGQGIDIRDTARDIVKRMGIWDRIRDSSSHEEGLEFIDSSNNCIARFGVDLSGKGDSFTSDVEILRGALSGILYDVTKDDVDYIFGDMIESLEETENEVKVTFAHSTPATVFDLVVAADGLGSKTRGIAFGDADSHIRSLDSCISYFSIPRSETDTMWARVHWFKGGRNMAVRPGKVGRTLAFLSLTSYSKADERLVRLAKAMKEGVAAQKALMQECFQDVEWEGPRILKGMHEADDFYMQHVAQVRLDHWSRGRVTLVGDAGYAPSPFTGMGTSLAFIGAYVLAGEISRRPDDIPAALEAYERILKPLVQSVQKLPPGIPWLVNPQTALGVRVLETVFWGVGLLSAAGVTTLVSKLAAFLPSFGTPFKLPQYEAFRQEDSASEA